MSWVIGRGGRILYKSDWTSAANVEAFLSRHEQGRTRRPQTGTVGPYLTEQVEYRDLDREAFYQRLHRNGSRAYHEFKRAEEVWRERETSRNQPESLPPAPGARDGVGSQVGLEKEAQ
jgi:hypothetical protein